MTTPTPREPRPPALLYLTEAEVATKLRVSLRTMQRHRAAGTGPTSSRIGNRRVVYQPTDVAKWVVGRHS